MGGRLLSGPGSRFGCEAGWGTLEENYYRGKKHMYKVKRFCISLSVQKHTHEKSNKKQQKAGGGLEGVIFLVYISVNTKRTK